MFMCAVWSVSAGGVVTGHVGFRPQAEAVRPHYLGQVQYEYVCTVHPMSRVRTRTKRQINNEAVGSVKDRLHLVVLSEGSREPRRRASLGVPGPVRATEGSHVLRSGLEPARQPRHLW